jgi:alpha-tubulin suppressor-like RCC1 family protein
MRNEISLSSKNLVLKFITSSFLIIGTLVLAVINRTNTWRATPLQGDVPNYTITMDVSNAPTESITYTTAETDIRYNHFEYNDVKASNGNHIELNAGGYIKNTINSRITSITSITAVFSTSGTLNLQTSFYGEAFTTSTLTSGVEHDLSAKLPYYLRLIAIEASVTIASITICYSCSSHENPLDDETRFIVSATAGDQHSMALTTSGRVYTWGYNVYGQLGDDTTTQKEVPTEITSNITGTVTQLVAGHNHSMALTSTGRVYTWGRNNTGQLGDNTVTQRNIPTEITSRITGTVTQIAADSLHSIALTSTGRVYTWGNNSNGQLGDDTTIQKRIPTEITSRITGTVTQIAAGNSYSMALTDTGRVYTWGDNEYGQLGDNTTTQRNVPTEITSRITGTTTLIVTKYWHSMALTDTGRVYTWGRNGNGQLGDNTIADKHVPTEITSRITGTVIQLAAGALHSMALTDTGRVYTWGWNFYGPLGDNTTTQRNAPTEITSSITGTTTQLAAGFYFSMAVTETGVMYTWGRNNVNQLGDNTTTQRNVPTNITSGFN